MTSLYRTVARLSCASDRVWDGASQTAKGTHQSTREPPSRTADPLSNLALAGVRATTCARSPGADAAAWAAVALLTVTESWHEESQRGGEPRTAAHPLEHRGDMPCPRGREPRVALQVPHRQRRTADYEARATSPNRGRCGARLRGRAHRPATTNSPSHNQGAACRRTIVRCSGEHQGGSVRWRKRT